MTDCFSSKAAADLCALVLARAPLRPAPGLPEIRLHLADASSGLSRLSAEGVGTPYWAYVWAGGAALARFVLDRPQTVRGRRVLDLGAGSGVVAIAAMLAGARSARAVDADPLAVAAAMLNAEANGVVLEVVGGDAAAVDPSTADLILAGDVFYEPRLARRMADRLARCVAAGVEVMVGDPSRRALPLERLRLLAELPAPDFGGATAAPSGVYAFER